MYPNPFNDKDTFPDEKDMKQFLGSTYGMLEQLRAAVKDAVGSTREEWKYYGRKNGWLLKTLYNKRNLYFLQMGKGYFVASFVFGEKAVECIRQSGISPGYVEALEQSRKYSEGRGLSVKVERLATLRDIMKLLRCKIDH